MDRDRGTVRLMLAVCAILEAVLFIWLVRHEGTFYDFVMEADSGYIGIAEHLVTHGTFSPNTRTIGYPLFLALGRLLGGARYGVHVVIAMQLALNLLFTYGLWRLLGRTVPEAGTALRVFAFTIFFVAGLGMAILVMTDFLAAFLFFVFLYGMLFWRRRLSLLASASALFMATLTRPTFTFIPFLVPFLVIEANRIRKGISRGHLALFIVASTAATGVSIVYQYAWYGYPGPSSVVAFNLKTTMYHALAAERMSKAEYLGGLEREIGGRAGRPYEELSKREQERFSRALFIDALLRHPVKIASQIVKTFFKYLLVPIETLVSKFWSIRGSGETYRSYGRLVLFFVFLPVWILSVLPPAGAIGDRRAYYVFMLMVLLYVLGISTIAPGQGERIRFSVLAFMLPVMVMNAAGIRARLSGAGRRRMEC